MVILPYGHDQTVYGRQWIMWILIALNVAVFLVSALLDRGASTAIHDAASAVDRVHAQYPDARVRPKAVEALPPELQGAMDELVSDDPDDMIAPGAAALGRSVKRLVIAVNDKPAIRFGYRPGKPSALGFFTMLFMHGDLEHLLGNMLFLWLAGAVIECFWEPLPFTILYFAAGFAGTAAHHLASPDSMTPLIGASGAISGLLGAFVVGHPRTKIKLLYATWLGRPFIGTIGVPAFLLIPGWLALQVGFALLAKGGGVAYWAHVGGFVAGVIGALIMRFAGWVTYDAEQVLNKPKPQ